MDESSLNPSISIRPTGTTWMIVQKYLDAGALKFTPTIHWQQQQRLLTLPLKTETTRCFQLR